MKNRFRSFVLVALVLLALSASAQTIITPTTLSSAIADSKTTYMVVASATGISAPAQPTGPQLPATDTNCYIADGTTGAGKGELVTVRGVSGTTITIRRGAGGTVAAPHIKNALVFCSSPQNFISRDVQAEQMGSCTRGTAPADVLPKINVKTGVISDCLAGVWVNGINNPVQRFRLSVPEPGGTAYTSLNTNGTTLVAGTTYCSEVNLPADQLLTGVAVLAGTTVATDNWLVILYDGAGNKLANSATAGAVTATSSTYQRRDFTSKFFAVGPAQYFACFQSNGTTDTARMVVTGTQDNLLTKSFTGTFGTITALTVPTTFTTAVGPYVYLY